MCKFHSKPLAVGNYHNKVSQERAAAVTFNQCAQGGKKIKALCVPAGGWMSCSWQFARLPNRSFLMYYSISGEAEMLGSSCRPSSSSVYWCACQSPWKRAHLLPDKCNVDLGLLSSLPSPLHFLSSCLWQAFRFA